MSGFISLHLPQCSLDCSFRTFGPLRYARITMDHETGRSRGTGFVCFWNVEDADKAVEKSDLLRLETIGSTSTVSLISLCGFRL